MMYRVAAAALVALIAGCGHRDRPPARIDGMTARLPTDWRRVATPADRDRLRDWRASWIDAVARARASGAAGAIAAQGALFDADRTLTKPLPPAGDYRCRVFKLGAASAGTRDFTAYPTYSCRIDDEGEVASFHTTAGAQRPIGLIFDDPGGRAIFLGTMMLRDETRPIDYGTDDMRDMAGYVDRIGERRWRIVLPAPHFESRLDVIELTPVS